VTIDIVEALQDGFGFGFGFGIGISSARHHRQVKNKISVSHQCIMIGI
jgi:gamma-glutamyl phosphate reductase